jgi:hypothetical protein|tara:strand:- start:70 stop:459 length:390 start_codon:yes stop_codon:yes gene_type:complete
MARPKKTKISLNKDSLTEFMQEIYNDSVNMMNTARKELNERKNRAEVDDIGDEYQIGKVNNETIKIIDSAIDKKLALAKLQSQIVSNTKSDDGSSNTDSSLSEDDKDTLRELFKKQNDNTNSEYDLGED